LGSCAVLVGLAMGAKLVVASGRDDRVLDQLRIFSTERVVAVKLGGDLERDKRAIAVAANGADMVYDMVYDMLGNARSCERDPNRARRWRRIWQQRRVRRLQYGP